METTATAKMEQHRHHVIEDGISQPEAAAGLAVAVVEGGDRSHRLLMHPSPRIPRRLRKTLPNPKTMVPKRECER